MATNPGVRKTVTALLVFVALVLAATWGRQIWLVDDPSSHGPPALQQDGVLVFPEPQPIDAFTLIDQNGRPVSRGDLKGQWTLAFLGYSQCETDQCAATLETLGRFAAEVAGTTSAVPAFWYVSVDPQRDDPDTLRDYLQALELDIRGLTGEPQALQSLAASLKGAFNRAARAEAETGPFEFSSHVGLIAPDASLVAIAQQPLDSQALAGAYRQLVAWYEGR